MAEGARIRAVRRMETAEQLVSFQHVHVQLCGGAPWGFTLKGGLEHGEPLIISKIEEGGKAAQCKKLHVGDELVNISGSALYGSRQEALVLIKGSYRTLKMVVRRQSVPVIRPHSWHLTKLSEPPIITPDTPPAMQLHPVPFSTSWHSGGDNSDSSMQWNQPCGAEQTSSLGSMESLDPSGQGCYESQLSPVDPAIFNDKRDSAYSSFSASSNTSDCTVSLRQGDAGSMDNLLSGLGQCPERCSLQPANSSNQQPGSLSQPLEDAAQASSCSCDREQSETCAPPQPPTRRDSFQATRGCPGSVEECCIVDSSDCQAGVTPAGQDIRQSRSQCDSSRDGACEGSLGHYYTLSFDQTKARDSSPATCLSAPEAGCLSPSLSPPDAPDEELLLPPKSWQPTGGHRHSAPEKLLSAHLQQLDVSGRLLCCTPSPSLAPKEQVAGAASGPVSLRKLEGSRCSTPGSVTGPEQEMEPLVEPISHVWTRSISMPGEKEADQRPVGANLGLSGASSMDALLEEVRAENDKATETRPRLGTSRQRRLARSRRHNERFATNLRNEIQRKKAQLQKCPGPGAPAYGDETVEEEEDGDEGQETTELRPNLQSASCTPVPLSKPSNPQPRVPPLPSTRKCPPRVPQRPEPVRHGYDHSAEELGAAGKVRRWRWTPEHKLQPELERERRIAGGVGQNEGKAPRWSSSSRADDYDILPFAERMKFFEATSRSQSVTNLPDLTSRSPGPLSPPAHTLGVSQRRYSYQGCVQHPSQTRKQSTSSCGSETEDFHPLAVTKNVCRPQNNVQSHTESRAQDHPHYVAQGHAQNPTQSHADSHTQNPTQSHADSQTQNYTQNHIQSHTHGHTQNHTQSHAGGHTQNHTLSHAGGHTQNHTQSHADSHTQNYIQSHPNGHSQNYTQRRSHGYTQSNAIGHTQNHAESCTHSHTQDNVKDHPQSYTDGYTQNFAQNCADRHTQNHDQMPAQNHIPSHVYGLTQTHIHAHNHIQSHALNFPQTHAQTHTQPSPEYCESRPPRSAFRPVTAESCRGDQPPRLGHAQRSHTSAETHPARVMEQPNLNRKFSLTEGEQTCCRQDLQPVERAVQGDENHWRDSRAVDSLHAHSKELSAEQHQQRGRARSEGDIHLKTQRLQMHVGCALSELQESTVAPKKRGPPPPRPPPPNWKAFHRRQASQQNLFSSPSPTPPGDASCPQRSGHPPRGSGPSSPYGLQISRQRSHSLPLDTEPEKCWHCCCERSAAPCSPAFTRRAFRPVVSPPRQHDPPRLNSRPPPPAEPYIRSFEDRPNLFRPIAVTQRCAAEWDRGVCQVGQCGPQMPAPKPIADQVAQAQVYSKVNSTLWHQGEPCCSPLYPREVDPLPMCKDSQPLETDIDEFQDGQGDDGVGIEIEVQGFAQPVTVLETDIDALPDVKLHPSEVPRPRGSLVEALLVADSEDRDRAELLGELLPPAGDTEHSGESLRGGRRVLEMNMDSLERRSRQGLPGTRVSCSGQQSYCCSIDVNTQQFCQTNKRPGTGDEDEDEDLSYKRQLMESLRRKLAVLRDAQRDLQDDVRGNARLGEEVESLVLAVCRPAEVDKFRMLVGDLDKVVSLVLSLSARLLRVEGALDSLSPDACHHERLSLLDKKQQLLGQLSEARELKEHVDRRERAVCQVLGRCLTPEQLRDYGHFIKMKAALLVEQRQLEDKIRLGEEQLRGLRESLGLGFGVSAGLDPNLY